MLGSKCGRILGAAGLGAMGSNRAIIMSITNVNVLKNTQLKIIKLFWEAIGATDLGHHEHMEEIQAAAGRLQPSPARLQAVGSISLNTG